MVAYLPNTKITTNEHGTQVISDSIANMAPKRIWNICANTVIPAGWFSSPCCPLTSHQLVTMLGVTPISHMHGWQMGTELIL